MYNYVRFSLATQGPALTKLQKRQLLRTRLWGTPELTYQRASMSWEMSSSEKWLTHNQFSVWEFSTNSLILRWNRTVYDQLVENGTIVPAEEVPPPTVPMDYSWARVRTLKWFYKFANHLEPKSAHTWTGHISCNSKNSFISVQKHELDNIH